MSFGREHKGRRVRLKVEAWGLPAGTEGVVDRVWRGRYGISFGGSVWVVKRVKFEFVEESDAQDR